VARPLLSALASSDSGTTLVRAVEVDRRVRVYSLSDTGYARVDNNAKGTSDVAGISIGGLIVILGIILIFVWSFWWGLIIALIGLLAFGGFARGRWY
jgi:hypothetical protein